LTKSVAWKRGLSASPVTESIGLFRLQRFEHRVDLLWSFIDSNNFPPALLGRGEKIDVGMGLIVESEIVGDQIEIDSDKAVIGVAKFQKHRVLPLIKS
jgi:hypothetical protein